MTSYAMANNDREGSGRVDQTLRWIGDLDHPFYSDERNRFVWYEASAIAFQLLFLGSYLIAGATLWVGGAEALPWVMAMFIPTMLTVVVFQGYLKRHSAEYWPGKNDLFRSRGQLAVFAGVFLLSGMARASLDLSNRSDADGFTGGLLDGLQSGALAGILAGAIAGVGVLVFKSRQQDAAADEDEF